MSSYKHLLNPPKLNHYQTSHNTEKMEVKSLTWTRDIHDIYDYESKELSQQTLVINTEE